MLPSLSLSCYERFFYSDGCGLFKHDPAPHSGLTEWIDEDENAVISDGVHSQ